MPPSPSVVVALILETAHGIAALGPHRWPEPLARRAIDVLAQVMGLLDQVIELFQQLRNLGIRGERITHESSVRRTPTVSKVSRKFVARRYTTATFTL
jgi:hypothetical protein